MIEIKRKSTEVNEKKLLDFLKNYKRKIEKKPLKSY